MRTSLEHLPLRNREQLVNVTETLQRLAEVEMLILFGSYARGDWVEDEKNGYFSDYDLLVLIDSLTLTRTVAWNHVSKEIRTCTTKTPVGLIVEDVRHVNTELGFGQYFYMDIVKEGVLLHDSKRFELNRPNATTHSKRLELALEEFPHWFNHGTEFWRGARAFAGRDLAGHSAFLLHQAAESYLYCVLVVCTGYRPKSHDLVELSKAAAKCHPSLVDALPRTRPADARHFDLLRRGYVDARYSRSYRATGAELNGMLAMVRDLGVRVHEACADRLSPIGSCCELLACRDALLFAKW